MPIYEFECRKCKARLEVFQKMSDKPPVKCRQCGGRLDRLQSAPAIQFKGSGWYVTDYAGQNRKAGEKAEKDLHSAATSDDKKSDKADKGEKSDKASDNVDKGDKADKKTKDSSPAKKTSEKASASKVRSGD
jgi:putative FmdB family regulatory protein